MTKARIPETDTGIAGEVETQMYDVMMRKMRDRGWIETNLILKAGILSGTALEIGPGPDISGSSGSRKQRAPGLSAWKSVRT
jgi:hypothetical protein